MIYVTPDVIANVYNYLLKRPFDEVVNIITPLHNEVDPQFKALQEKTDLTEAPIAPSEQIISDVPADQIIENPAP
jgi:hypothetical protein